MPRAPADHIFDNIRHGRGSRRASVFQGLVAGLIILAYALIYQQIENCWLSPRLSSKTMELNGALAFGSALAGGAIAGPMGAFMALPVAALISSFISNYRTPHEVVYESTYAGADDTGPAADDESASSQT